MSKQAKTYLLLTLVAVIWGLIGFKVVNALSPEEEAVPIAQPKVELPKTKIQQDTFSLIANYRDPFLGTLPKPKSKTKKPGPKKVEQPKKQISYAGLVSQSGAGGSLFFVTVDGQQHIMGIKEEVDGVRLLSGNASRIRIRCNGKSETIPLSE